MSTIKVDNLQTTGGAGLYPARAWVNFNGTGTVSIRADGNVSSITDNGVGNYAVNYSSSFSDANCCGVGGIGSYEAYADDMRYNSSSPMTTASVVFQFSAAGTIRDGSQAHFSAIR